MPNLNQSELEERASAHHQGERKNRMVTFQQQGQKQPQKKEGGGGGERETKLSKISKTNRTPSHYNFQPAGQEPLQENPATPGQTAADSQQCAPSSLRLLRPASRTSRANLALFSE